MNKEECVKELEKAVSFSIAIVDRDGFINFEKFFYETTVFECFRKLVKEHFDPQPYKFEDLKPNLWVWDDKEKLCNLIYETRINCAGEQEIEFQFTMINLDGDEFLNDIFEENRFFPITKTLQYQDDE